MKTRTLLILCLCLLAACAPGDDGQVTSMAAVDTATPEPETPTAVAAHTSTATATLTPSPTEMATPSPTPTLAPELQTYLDHALDLIQEKSIYSTAANWAELRTWANDAAAGAQSTADLYPAIKLTLNMIQDRHGYLMPPADADAYFEAKPGSLPAIQFELLQGQFGYIVVPSFASGNVEMVPQFASHLQAAIAALDAQEPCGWIIDLRYNEGGNGFGMLAGLAPLLGDGEYGGLAYPNGDRFVWRYQAGRIYLGDSMLVDLSDAPYQLQEPGQPVAVLTSEVTTSAGEMVAIAFHGWPQTRSFGQKTLGQTTGPEGFVLSDGAILGITVAYYSDHTGQIYQDGITPDDPIVVKQSALFRDDSVPPPAIDWLLSQASCQVE